MQSMNPTSVYIITVQLFVYISYVPMVTLQATPCIVIRCGTGINQQFALAGTSMFFRISASSFYSSWSL